MKSSTWPIFCVLSVLLFTGSFSCTESEPVNPIPLFAQESCDESERVLDSDQSFRKPSETNPPSDPFHTLDGWQPSIGSEISGMMGREYMHPVGSFPTEYWIEEYEPATFDISIGISSVEGPATYDLMVLVDFEPVEFGVREAPDRDSLAHFDEIEGELELDVTQEFHLEETDARVISVFLPPTSFKKVGTQDIRVIFLKQMQADPDKLMVMRRLELNGFFAVIHRGAEGCTAPNLHKIEAQKFHRSTDEVLYRFAAAPYTNTYLQPSEAHFERPEEFPTLPNFSSALSDVFEIEDPRFELNAHIRIISERSLPKEEFVGVFVNGQLDPDASGIVRIPSFDDRLEEGIFFSFEIDLSNSTEETTSVQFARFPRPQNSLSCHRPGESFACEMVYSNKIFVRMVE